MNVLFTSICNLQCPYCFARGKIRAQEGPQPLRFMPRDNLRTVLRFLANSGVDHFSVLGGEPTLHPEFSELMEMILREGFRVYLFTNGIIERRDVIDHLKAMDGAKVRMVVNVNSPDSYTAGQRRLLTRTFKELPDKIALGHTVHESDFEGEFLLDLISKYGLKKRIRIGIAAPLFNTQNRYVALKDHRKAAARIVRFAGRCDRHDIGLDFDCGFRLCSFTPEQIGRLVRYNSPLKITCVPVVDVGPDLQTWRCFATSGLFNRPLSAFKTLQEMERSFEEKFRSLISIGPSGTCRGCKYFARRQCTGGCLGHTLKSLHGAAPARRSGSF